jgi:hypothetical protein
MKQMLLALLLLLSGCSTDPDGTILTVINRTRADLVVLAHSGMSTLDPALEVDPGQFPDNVVASGGTLDLDVIPGYAAGQDVELLVYVVRLDVATLNHSLLIPAAAVEANGRVTIRDIASPRDPADMSR